MEKPYYIEPGIDAHREIQLLEDKIYEHNAAALDKDDGHLFSRIVKDENKQIIGGIAGWTWASACEITQLWVNEIARKKGLGKMLLDAAETEAKERGCLTILVRSYSFQAPHFYEKYGYKAELILNGFPNGHSYFILAKRIG